MAGTNGLCECGCGVATKLHNQSDTKRGVVKGQPRRFLPGHNAGRPGHVVSDDGCWNFTGSRRKTDGRAGSIRHRGRQVSAYVAYYERAKGPIPDGMVLDHLCKNAGCVNPDHLEVVTQATNVRRGPGLKLTKALAHQIRALKGILLPGEIAANYGVSDSLVRAILANRKWRDEEPAHVRRVR